MINKARILFACSAIAVTLPLISCARFPNEAPEAILLSNANGEFNHWNGIGKIFKGDRAYCSAFLIDTRERGKEATGPAYIMTNAHCTSIKVGTTADVAYQGQMQFNFFHDTLAGARRYDIDKVNWASFASTDISILQLRTSLDSLLKDGITPLKLAAAAPRNVSQVNLVGAPASAPGLRLSTCTQEPTHTTLIKYLNVHTDYQKQNCKGIEPGSSGAPVIDMTTGEVTGILSGTTYGISSDDLCFWHGLCSDNLNKSLLPHQASQSFPVDYLTTCFTNGNFSLDKETCAVSPNSNFKLRLNSRAITDIGLHKAPASAAQQIPKWDISFSMSTGFYRFKTVRHAQACYSPDQYNDPISTVDANLQSEIGQEAGLYYLCLIGVNSTDQQSDSGLLGNAQILAARVVTPVPVQLPAPTLTVEPDGDYLFIKYREEADRNLWTRIYTGPAETTHCAQINPERYSKVDDGFYIPIQALPLTLCSYTMDRNLSVSEVRADQLRPTQSRITE
ncbi:serine protease [Pseudomonas sp. rhizo66]|uniref:trypsin-like serine peptidase n=1 Tax=Pseudomonas sp. rhizo66 TaxID=3059674 RepID=UPI00288C91AF|nr:serine protease [Pseudomonas sp. rhizo66]MDT3314695.1 serine protease [Pseudomonas sp. rhizo66]